jgi:hypothetical protein
MPKMYPCILGYKTKEEANLAPVYIRAYYRYAFENGTDTRLSELVQEEWEKELKKDKKR